jgi:hypothetical protein
MNRRKAPVFLTVLMILAGFGCNLTLTGLPGAAPAGGSPGEEDSRAAAARTLTAMAEGRRNPPAVAPTGTEAPQATVTATPSITLTATPNKVTVAVSQNTNCRTGPDKQFDLVGILKVGETAEAIGRNEQKTYWVIKLPANTAKTCWLWYEWATVTGDGDALPVIQSPPTPTWSPKPDFSFSFAGLAGCPMANTIKLQVTNTGNVAWESFHVRAVDLTTDADTTYSSNDFPGFPACGWTSVPAIPPGQTALAIGYAPPGSSGHAVLVQLHLYTGNGLTGTHMTGDFTFTP